MTHVAYPGCYCADCVEADPSARITGDKDRENPVEGAPHYAMLQVSVALYDALRRNRIGWENAIDLDLLPERHRLDNKRNWTAIQPHSPLSS